MLTPVAKFKTACWTCRKRKIKCAKIQPCRNCTIAGIACSYPPQVRTVRRPKKATSRSVSNDKSGADIFDRVGRLEALLNDRPQFPQMDGVGDGVFDPQKFPYEQLQDQAGGTHGMTPTSASGQPHPSPSSTNASASHQEDTDEDQDEDDEYWKKLEEECAGKVFLKTPTSVGGTMASSFHVSSFDKPKPESSPNGFPLNLSPTTLRAPLLSVTQRRVCLHRYLENVDPILKILHKPALENLMSMSDRNTPMLCASARVLIQAVCLLSITSMSEEEVLVNFENDKQWMLEKCAASTEQALVEANFLVADDLRTLQALLLFLYYLRYKGDPRLNALSGATISLASQMKLNRDGTALGLSRLEVELRRRLWWQLVNLVDHPDNSTLGCSPLSGIAADTELPSNINDFELERQDAPLGEKHGGFTDFSFCLMQYEITRAFNQIKSESSAHRDANACGAEKRLHSVREILELKYFRDETTDLPIRRFAADVVAMILAKRRILMYISLDEENGGGSLPPRTRDHLFLLALALA
ncbi:putative c6 transcription protein [Phaeoacremonium minimum UCRPA7]|uniref:Putative c6 transcription protein n=1 Tax=Phaeoacremonium minimum (strain UCR-PA7) TaxID=1286976 RepID=R8BSY7_PHAM7|nr:putative c6 transcription protein [Phaeoacremonium minimum UCRPA7]EOO02414.1 putative c6 transcription protein [Phaeoacremonium minimum UCRPA7]